MKTFLALVAALAWTATLSSAVAQSGNASPAGVKPNYQPASATKTSSKPGKGQVVSSGGQGHNSTRDPKSQTRIAPTTPARQNRNTGSTNMGSTTKPGSH